LKLAANEGKPAAQSKGCMQPSTSTLLLLAVAAAVYAIAV
jgi:hypothetical protein